MLKVKRGAKNYTLQPVHLLKKWSLLALLLFPALSYAQKVKKTIVWKLDDKRFEKNVKATKLGEPIVRRDGSFRYLWFDGKDDGLIIKGLPIENVDQFTIQMLFNPDGDGPLAPRMMHFQDKIGNRGTLEARLIDGKLWYMDTFLKNGTTNKGVTLIDSTRTHPVGKWYWVAMVYDGKRMSSYVNGIKELEAEVDFPGLSQAETALAVRLNKVAWFKGGIKELRFVPFVLNQAQLKKLH